ncbi:MAG: hypothetical protein FJW36_10485 [Acidobacteria bacterium]|nr:hypothetical protein [Acidobacteriota bacterium]
MRFLRADEVPLGSLMVYRISPTGPIVNCLLYLPMMGMLSWQALRLPWVWIVVGFLLLIEIYTIRQVRDCFGPQAWLVAIGNGSMSLKWRPYQNTHLPPDDLQVAKVELSRFAGAQRISRWTLSEHSAHFDDCVELTFSSSLNPRPLGDHLLDEQNKGSTRGQFPMILHSGNVLRVQWQCRPGVREFLRVLESHEIPAKL